MTDAQTAIQQRVIARVKELGLNPENVSAAIDKGDLYGSFTHTTYRNLVTQDFANREKPRTTFNRQLLIALSDVLNCSIYDLATEYELSQIRDVPYRRAQWPQFMLDELRENEPKRAVPMPAITARRIVAYAKQHAYNNATEFADRMWDYGYHVSSRDMRHVFARETKPDRLKRIVTFEFCEAAAQVFRGKLNRHEFRTEWLLQCTDTCPHCRPDLYLYG